MFRRSFKPDKFKLALKLAIPRIKLMKNKREAHFKQLKRELAQLLESGKDQTARIRVEHVVNEEKTMAAYDLLEIYCELIVARMPMIESQKNCPIDLKEAISSVIFASARCEEIPELKDVTKHLTAKYGKDFTSSALELRPDCGVGRLLVEKLSIKPPDGQTKLKILTAIAEEHNIKWDPESFGAKESKIYDDLLNGPNALLEATKISAACPNAQASTSHYEQRPPSVQAIHLNVQSPKHIAKNDAPSSFNEHSSRLSPHPKIFYYSNTTASSSISSGTYPPRSKTRETEYQGMEFRNSFYGNESAFPSPRQHGNMEFKDAAAAAMAAAESAERASMDARAAAEYLGNISQQYSMESNMSAHDMRDEEPRKSTGSTSQYEHARHPVNNSFHGRNSTNCEQTDSNEQHNRTGETENGLSNIMRNDDKSTCGSSKSTAAAFNEKPLVTNQTPDAYSQRNTSFGRQMEHFGEVSMKRNSGNEMHMHFVNGLHGIKNPQNVDHHEVKDGEQSRYSSSHSRSNTFRDDCDVASNLNWQKSQNDQRNSDEKKQFVNELHDRTTSDFTDYQEGRIGKQSSCSSSSSSNTFADDLHVVSDLNCPKPGIFSVENSFLFKDKESLPRSTIETTDFYDNASAVFDDYGSHLEEEHKVHEYSMNFSSPFQKSPTHPCPCTHSWSTEKKVEPPEVSISRSHIFSEKRSTPVFFESSTTSAGPSHVDDLPPTFDNYGPSSESEEEVDKFDRNNNSSIGSQKNNLDSHQAGNSIFDQPLSGGMEDTELSTDSGLEESKELNLGNLTDGLRNKGYMHPPSARFKQSSPPLVEDSVSSGSYNREPKAGPSHVVDLPPTFDNYGPSSESEEEVDKFDRYNNSSIGSQKKNLDSHQAGNSIFDQPLSGGMEDTELSMDSSLEESKELNLGNLTDGLRNKGYMHPPSGRFKQSSPPLVEDSVSSGSYNREPKGSDEVSRKLSMRASVTHFDSSDDEEERSKHISSSTRDQYNRMPSFEDRRSTFTVPVPGNCDSDEELPKTSSMAHSRTVLSHKKHVSPSNSPRNSTLKTTLSSEPTEKNSSSRSSGADETPLMFQPQERNLNLSESFQHSQLASEATSKLVSETKTSSSDETLKMSEKEQPHTSVPEIVSLSSAESSEAQTSIGERSAHVHPKLPDYDTLTAFLNSLKQNRP